MQKPRENFAEVQAFGSGSQGLGLSDLEQKMNDGFGARLVSGWSVIPKKIGR